MTALFPSVEFGTKPDYLEIDAIIAVLTPDEQASINLLQRRPLPQHYFDPSPYLILLKLVDIGDDDVPFLTELGVEIGIGLYKKADRGGISA